MAQNDSQKPQVETTSPKEETRLSRRSAIHFTWDDDELTLVFLHGSMVMHFFFTFLIWHSVCV